MAKSTVFIDLPVRGTSQGRIRPPAVGLILDKAIRVAQQFTFEKDAAALFISRLMNSSQDLAFVLGFSDQPALVQDLTPDTQALTGAVRNITTWRRYCRL
ncbi:MAG TPA: hypothetical protein VGP65_16930 [Candidatus Angelobacter sp.]|nr:hypothetical protein [Candidatus Angelobacter sp.]